MQIDIFVNPNLRDIIFITTQILRVIYEKAGPYSSVSCTSEASITVSVCRFVISKSWKNWRKNKSPEEMDKIDFSFNKEVFWMRPEKNVPWIWAF